MTPGPVPFADILARSCYEPERGAVVCRVASWAWVETLDRATAAGIEKARQTAARKVADQLRADGVPVTPAPAPSPAR